MQYCIDLLPNIKTRVYGCFSHYLLRLQLQNARFFFSKESKPTTISQERLNGLTLTNINKEEYETVEEIIKVFINNSARRMQLLQNWSK